MVLCHSSRKSWIALDIFEIFKGKVKVWDPLFKRHFPQWHLRGMLKMDFYFLFVWFYSDLETLAISNIFLWKKLSQYLSVPGLK